MRASVVAKPGPMSSGSLELTGRPVPEYPFSQADQALADLEAERVHGAAVLQM